MAEVGSVVGVYDRCLPRQLKVPIRSSFSAAKEEKDGVSCIIGVPVFCWLHRADPSDDLNKIKVIAIKELNIINR